MTRVLRYRAYLGLGLAVLAFVVSLSWSINSLSVQEEILQSSTSSGGLTAVQAEVEFLRLLETLDRYRLGDQRVTHDDLAIRFEIFWSRLPIILKGTGSEPLRAIPGLSEAVQGMLATLEALEPKLLALLPGDDPAYRDIHGALLPFGPVLHDLVHGALLDVRPTVLAHRFRYAYLWVLFSFGGILLSAAVLVILLARQIHASQRANRALDEARAETARASQRLTDALETMSDGFVLFDADDRLVLCNSRFRAFFSPGLAHLIGPGMKFEEVLRAATDAGEVVAAKGREEAWIAERMRARRESSEPVDIELSDGRWARAREWRTRDGGKVGIRTDITELKRIEEALRDSERRFRTLVEQAADAFFVHDLDGRFVDVNQEACDTLGYTREELLELSVGDVAPRAPMEVRRQRWKEMKPGDVAVVEGVQRRKDATTFPVDIRTCALDTDGGRMFLALARDATERRQFEEALQESQRFLQTLIDAFPASVNVKDGQHRLVHVNRYMAEVHGIDRDHMIGKTLAELGLSASRDAEARDRQVYRSGSAIPAGEIELVTKDGPKTWLETKVPIEDDEGGVKYVLTVAFDIDERKQMEQALRASEERYRTLVETSPHGISETRLDGIIAYANPAYHRILGYGEGTIAGKAIWDLIASAPDRESLKKSFAVRVKQHVPPSSYETHWVTKLGVTIDVQIDWNYMRDQSGAVDGFMAIATEITDRKRTEEALRASQTFLKAVIDTIPAIISVKDRDHRYAMVNRTFVDRFGGREEKLLGKRPVDVAVPFADSVAQKDIQVFATGQPIPFHEMENDIGTGPTTWMTTNVPIRDAQGTVDHVLTVMFDISDRKRTEEALRESEAMNRALFATAADAIITIDERGEIERFNPAAERMFGYAAGEAEGQNVKMFVPAPDHDRHGVYLARYRGSGEPKIIGIDREVVGLRKDGTRFPIELAVSEMELDGRRLLTGIVRDITERLEAQAAIIAAQKAQLASQAKSEFLANVSHELRTPLNAIIGFAEMLGSGYAGRLAPKQLEYVRDIGNSGGHLLELINDILDVSKIEAGKIRMYVDDVDIAHTIRAAVRLVRERAHLARVELTTSASRSLPMLRADERMVKRILLNLLSNAVKFTPEGGTVSVAASIGDDGCFQLTVRDTGIGIAEENLATVMEPFGQVESNLNRTYEGTGLGLPLVKSMVDMHGGTMAIESGLDAGTLVTISFPENRIVPRPADRMH